MGVRIEQASSVVVAIAAVVIAGTFVLREVPAGDVAGRPRPPEFVRNWTEALTVGILDGDTAAPVRIVEFGDFECPFCARFHETYRAVRKQNRTKVALVFVHFPISSHRFAVPAARSAECAAEQGRFGPFSDVIFLKQDSLGLKSWVSFAREAGVADTLSFARCAASPASMLRILAGKSVAKQFQVTGTPTVIVNGWRYHVPPDSAELSRVVAAVMAGQAPFKKR